MNSSRKESFLLARSQSNMNEMIRLNTPLVKSTIRKYQGIAVKKGFDSDDLLAVGLQGLWNACKKWNPERGEFSTIATMYIKRQVMLLLNTRKHFLFNRTTQVSTEPQQLEYLVESNSVDQPTPFDNVELLQVYKKLNKKAQANDKKSKAILMRLDGNTIEDISSELHVDKSKVNEWLSLQEESTNQDMALIPGFESKYGITKDGRVWSYSRKEFLHLSTDKNGNKRVALSTGKNSKTVSVASLLTEAYGDKIPMKNIPKLEHYYALTEDGRLWSHVRKKFVTPKLINGQVFVNLMVNGKGDKRLLSDVMAKTYGEKNV
jgi:RNA polymerase sigma factor (sigma-70 family)